jgi:organic radical activating enzyme
MNSLWKPITETQCVLKWAWSTVLLFNGARVKSCFKNPALPLENIKNFHNIKQLVQDRKEMLSGKWPSGCYECKQVEELGSISDRLLHNKFQHLVSEDLRNNTDISKIKPSILEIYFRNTCNMSCIYCTPMLSSKFTSEMKKYGEFENNGVEIKNSQYNEQNYSEILIKFWEILIEILPTLKEVNVLGGEPFLLPELEQLIDILDQYPAPDLDLSIISNLNIPHEIFCQSIKKLQKLQDTQKVKSIKINASIDGWDKSIEFQRYGLSLKLFENNFLYLLNQTNLRLSINYTATCIGIPSMPELMAKWAEWNKIRQVDLSGNKVETYERKQEYLDLDTLPASFLLPYLSKSLEYIDSINHHPWQRERIENLKIYLEKQNSQGDKNKLKKLKIFIEEISKRRNIKWIDYYPWLESFFNE